MTDIYLSGTGDLSGVVFCVPKCSHQEIWTRDLEAAGFGKSNEEIYQKYSASRRKADMGAFWQVKEWMGET